MRFARSRDHAVCIARLSPSCNKTREKDTAVCASARIRRTPNVAEGVKDKKKERQEREWV